ncbi:HNH endonuclease [Kitasatospora sp. NPDC001261]|uniref:HNH endonuclease n=1 Tax=Kitasatospora sp. NPDC001261 TaxID=3364012 RepID=UPI00367689E8
MDTHEIQHFYKVLADAFPTRWTEDGLRRIAQLNAPSGILGKNEWLLRADYAMTVGRWFLEGIIDVRRHARGTSNIGHVFKEVRTSLTSLCRDSPADEIDGAATELASLAWREVVALRGAGRERITRSMKVAVWLSNGPDQRCYLCGYSFSIHARDLLLGRTRANLAPLSMVDFTRPRGANWRHLRIELDHEIPVAEGGVTDESNLRLTCGWCNVTKSSLWSFYDAKAWIAGEMNHPTLGFVSIPQPLWMLRIVAARGRCEAAAGCTARLENSELFVAPHNPTGSMTPTNLLVVCASHDPWAAHRLVSPALLPARR